MRHLIFFHKMKEISSPSTMIYIYLFRSEDHSACKVVNVELIDFCQVFGSIY